MSKVIGGILAAIGTFLATIWHGYVLSVLWGWFVVPTFRVAPINIAAAIGLTLFIGMLVSQKSEQKKEDESALENMFKSIIYSFVYGLTVLALGALVHAFM